MARTRRAAARRPSRRRGRAMRLPSFDLPKIPPDVARSIVGILLLVLGARTLIALTLPGRGNLTDWWIGSVGPWFGSVRWLLPFILLAAGWYVEWGPGRQPNSGWGLTLVGAAMGYAGLLGAVEIVGPFSGGSVGRFLDGALVPLITAPGAVVLLAGVSLAGVLLAFNLQLKQLLGPVTGTARWFGATAAASLRRGSAVGGAPAGATERARAGEAVGPGRGRTGQGAVAGGPPPAGQTGIWGQGDGEGRIPTAVPSTAPTSATFAPPRSGGAGGLATALVEPLAAPRPARPPDDVTDASASPPTRERIEYVLPPLSLLDDIPIPTEPGGAEILHQRNEEIIVRKLAGFNIPAKIVARNAGPVVTQYEVQPAPHIKVSRIEGLSDDLAMARTPAFRAPSPRPAPPHPRSPQCGCQVPQAPLSSASQGPRRSTAMATVRAIRRASRDPLSRWAAGPRT